MKKLIAYVLVFVLGFGACALILYSLGYLPGPDSTSGSVTQVLGRRNALPVGENEIADATAKVLPAVVNIDTTTHRNVPNPFGSGRGFFGFPLPVPFQAPDRVEKGAASGVIISKDGYILTNNHVVAGAQDIAVTLADGRKFKAKVTGRDSRRDIAVVKISAKNLPYATLGNSDDIRVGDWAIAVGNPISLGNTVTVGVVSAKKRTNLPVGPGKMIAEAIQTDAAINRGNSGGALANIRGEVIGINTAIYSTDPGAGNIGIGFAIPINTAKTIAKQIIEKGSVVYPYLGVMVADLSASAELEAWYEQNGYKGKGAVIFDVQKGSPADKAGLMQADVITKIDEKKVSGAEDVTKVIQKYKVGQVIRLSVWRAGTTRLVGAKLAETPPDQG